MAVAGGIWDHPRSRGEYPRRPTFSWVRPGSPPLARGILPNGLQEFELSGITPARAGNTHFQRGRCCHNRDHPRSREYSG